jgi:opacity protein-like surface antigen
MKTKLLSLVAALVLVSLPASANNTFWRTGWYTQGNLGLSTPTEGAFDTAPSIEGTVGKTFNNWLAFEATVGYLGTPTNEFNKRFDGTYVLVTPMLRYQNRTPFTPFMGVSGGYVWTSGSGAFDAGSFAWGPTVGFTMRVDPKWSLNVQYRFLSASESDVANTRGQREELQVNQFLVGFRFAW